MSEYQPVTTLADLATLDNVEVMEGYWYGFEGWPEPGNNRSRSFWHGWRNGALDGGHIKKDQDHAALAHNYLAQRETPTGMTRPGLPKGRLARHKPGKVCRGPSWV